jgi:hypothetical protein
MAQIVNLSATKQTPNPITDIMDEVSAAGRLPAKFSRVIMAKVKVID